MSRLPCLIAVAASLTLAACGSNTPEIPEEYLQTGGGSSSTTYPEGPYGASEGDIAANFQFVGWLNPKAEGFDFETADVFDLETFYDPDGTKGPNGEGIELILLNASAIWCTACRVEHEEFETVHADLNPRGLEIVSGLFQDRDFQPAKDSDLVLWTESFDVAFPMGLDSEFQMGAYGNAQAAPLNAIIDARTMEILKVVVGADVTIFTFLETELAARGR